MKFKKLKMKRENIYFIIALALILIVSTDTTAYATNNYAHNFSDWLMDGIKTIAVAIAAGMAIKFLAKRQFMQFVGFFILTSLILAIVFNPASLQTIGSKLMQVIFGT